MKKSAHPEPLTDIEFMAELTKLRENPRATTSHICRFLSDVFVYNYSLKGNKKFPILLPVDLGSHHLKVIDEKPCIVAKVSWFYIQPQRYLPTIDGVDKLLDGLTIKTDASINGNKKLGIDLTIDLSKWPHITRNLLHSYLSSKKDNADLDNDIKVLVDHFYPTTSTNVLQLSKDLGIVAKDKIVFKNWFEELSTNVSNAPVSLPVSFDMP